MKSFEEVLNEHRQDILYRLDIAYTEMRHFERSLTQKIISRVEKTFSILYLLITAIFIIVGMIKLWDCSIIISILGCGLILILWFVSMLDLSDIKQKIFFAYVYEETIRSYLHEEIEEGFRYNNSEYVQQLIFYRSQIIESQVIYESFCKAHRIK